MKIILEVNEIAAILREWAKVKYKTHNINCDFASNTTATLEIIASDEVLVDGVAPNAAMDQSKLVEAMRNIKARPEGFDTEVPDLMSEVHAAVAGVTEGLL